MVSLAEAAILSLSTTVIAKEEFDFKHMTPLVLLF